MGCGCKKVKAKIMPPSYTKNPVPSATPKVAPKVTVKR